MTRDNDRDTQWFDAEPADEPDEPCNAEDTICCSWCGDMIPLHDWDGTHEPYCSSRCAIHAEYDSEDR
jgi:hypothetical protein